VVDHHERGKFSTSTFQTASILSSGTPSPAHLAVLHATDVVYLSKLYGPRTCRVPDPTWGLHGAGS
jgi:hypothetical protein